MKRAKEHGIYVSLTLWNDNAVKKDDWWKANSYNAKNGGPAKSKNDLYGTSDGDSFKAMKERYLKIVNRYENNRALMMWDLVNDSAKTSAWKKQMYDAVRSADADNHIISFQYTPVRIPVAKWIRDPCGFTTTTQRGTTQRRCPRSWTSGFAKRLSMATRCMSARAAGSFQRFGCQARARFLAPLVGATGQRCCG